MRQIEGNKGKQSSQLIGNASCEAIGGQLDDLQSGEEAHGRGYASLETVPEENKHGQ